MGCTPKCPVRMSREHDGSITFTHGKDRRIIPAPGVPRVEELLKNLGELVAEVGKVPPDEHEAFVLEEGFFSACTRGLARQIKPTTGAAAAKGRRA